jgi:hypothetical protein
MTQLLASYRSTQADFVSIQASASQKSLAVLAPNKNSYSSILNKQENQLADEVNISPEAIKKFEEARRLEEFLDNYLKYLKGEEDNSPQKIKHPDDKPSAVVAGEATKVSASITAGRVTEETLEIAADIDVEGNLNSLSVTKTKVTTEFVQTELSVQHAGFYVTTG